MKVFFVLLLTLCANTIMAEEFEVFFDSIYTKGQKFRIEIKANLDFENKIVLEGKAVVDKNTKTKLEGGARIEILDIDSKGFIVKVKLVIESLKVEDVDVLPINSEIFAELAKDNSTIYKINNEPVSPEVSKYLNKIIQVKNNKSPTDQECFGGAKLVKIGDEWPINKDAFKRGLEDKQIKISDSFVVNGKCKLDQVNKVNGVDQLNVSCDLNFSGMELPLPGKMKYEKSKASMKFNAVFPNGKNKNRIDETEDSIFEVNASGEVTRNNISSKMEFQLKSHDVITRKFIY